MRIRLAVVIVSYNTRDVLRSCLASVRTAAVALGETVALDVAVVDNGSIDGSGDMVAHEFPTFTLYRAQENLGFARANNLALQRMGISGADDSPLPADLVLLLNPDTIVTAEALARMVAVFDTRPAAGVTGARLAYGDGTFQHGAFGFPGVAQVLIDLWLPRAMPGRHRIVNSQANGRYAASLWNGDAPFVVDFVLGAALMARASLFRQLGGLDEGYFMYCEEMDWCLRAREAGWEVLSHPRAIIVHLEGQSSRQVRWGSLERLWRSRMRFYEKNRRHFSPWTLPLVRLALRSAMARGCRAALRAFAHGDLDGAAAGEEVRARRVIAGL